MSNASAVNPSEEAVLPPGEPKRWQGIGSIIWSVVSLLLTALQTSVTEFAGFKILDSLSENPNYIAAAWMFLISSVITGVIGIWMGLQWRRTRLGCIGLILGAISLVGLVIWELCGGFIALFWAP